MCQAVPSTFPELLRQSLKRYPEAQRGEVSARAMASPWWNRISNPGLLPVAHTPLHGPGTRPCPTLMTSGSSSAQTCHCPAYKPPTFPTAKSTEPASRPFMVDTPSLGAVCLPCVHIPLRTRGGRLRSWSLLLSLLCLTDENRVILQNPSPGSLTPGGLP